MNYKKDGFSLEITGYKIEPIIVKLPKFKDSNNNTTDEYQTYQMAIDKFTTEFKNENEFREYLKEKYPVLKDKEFTVKMIYNDKESTFNGNTDLIFGNNGELVEFLKHSRIKNIFSKKDSNYVEAFIEGFRNEIIEKMTTHDYHHEYTEFITKDNFLYSKEMSKTMKTWSDTKDNDLIDKEKPFEFYENIRGHCISHYIDMILRLRLSNNIHYQDEDRRELEEEQKELERKIKEEKQELYYKENDEPKELRTISYSILSDGISPIDTNRDFLSKKTEILDEFKEKYDLKKYSNFTIDPDEEMERLNSLIDESNNHKIR